MKGVFLEGIKFLSVGWYEKGKQLWDHAYKSEDATSKHDGKHYTKSYKLCHIWNLQL